MGCWQALLEAWAATVTAAERMQIAMEAVRFLCETGTNATFNRMIYIYIIQNTVYVILY